MKLAIYVATATLSVYTLTLSDPLKAQTGTTMRGHQTKNLEQFLQEFHQNPSRVMNQLPFKESSYSKSLPFQVIPSEAVAQQGNAFIEEKDALRTSICRLEQGQTICATEVQGKAGFNDNDLTENLVDNGEHHIRKLSLMDEQNLQKARLEEQPWSDDYWAIKRGILSSRYADPDREEEENWQESFDYFSKKPISNYVERKAIDQLSPAEKYDLLVGDDAQTLTNRMWREGQLYYEKEGKVEDWMGICHGWAPASYMMARPISKIDVIAADGKTSIPFFPSDIKGLASLLWANTRTHQNFIGGRCNEKEPEVDEENGRIKDQQCFDTNPGTWHKAIVNQIGISRRSLIIDATYDYEVWNQPVYSYNYRYFNLETFEVSRHAADSRIELSDYTQDKFKSYRDKKTKWIVGVEMKIQYIAETHPEHRLVDNEEYDSITSAYYRYDLELDQEGSIIGGEWYSNAHPDFLWTPPKEGRALTRLDMAIIEGIEDEEKKGNDASFLIWEHQQSDQPVPLIWREHLRSFSENGQPLGLIVEGLIQRSIIQGQQNDQDSIGE